MKIPPVEFIKRVLDVITAFGEESRASTEDRQWFSGLCGEEREHAFYIMYLTRSYDIIEKMLGGSAEEVENAKFFYGFGYDTWHARKALSEFRRKRGYRQSDGKISVAIPVELAPHAREIKADLTQAFIKIDSYDIPANEKDQTFEAYIEKYMRQMSDKYGH